MNESFSVHRLLLLMRADLVARYRSVLIISGTLAGLIVVQGMLAANTRGPGESLYGPWLIGTLFIWGPIAASYSFRELNDKSRNEAYLLLPASALEKTVARLLLVTIVFGAYVLLFLSLASLLSTAVSWLVFGERLALFSADELPLGTLAANALVVQSAYFLGAAWYRKAHFIKTSLAITLAVIAFSALAALIAWFLLGDYFTVEGAFHDTLIVELVRRGAPLLYFLVLPPFCWWVAWLRVKEAQVSHGV